MGIPEVGEELVGETVNDGVKDGVDDRGFGIFFKTSEKDFAERGVSTDLVDGFIKGVTRVGGKGINKVERSKSEQESKNSNGPTPSVCK